MAFKRSSGILMHPTSLPGKYGIGTLGKEADRFVDFLYAAGQKIWQILPLGPTGYADCPYSSFSTFAGNPYLIDLDILQEEGLLLKSDLPTKDFPTGEVDYGVLWETRFRVLNKAFENYRKNALDQKKAKMREFSQKHAGWLSDFALFMALKKFYGGKPWNEWDKGHRNRENDALNRAREDLRDEIEFQVWMQYEFYRQWQRVHKLANDKGIQIMGDIPFYVSGDSADAWSNTDIFCYDETLKPTRVAGVPPDYFSATGQLWGNPLYNWDKMKENDFKWWLSRIRSQLELVDIIRIDHFRAFAAYWAVPYGEKTAVNGEWIAAPGKELFEIVRRELGDLPIVAEDLGLMTTDVAELRDYFGFPGMKVLQFAFDSDEENDYLPHTYNQNCIVYTGTHDNDTLMGWYKSAKEEDRDLARRYLPICSDEAIHRAFLRAAWASTALFAIVPVQDILGLGSEARMNVPGVAEGNWKWRVKDGDLTTELVVYLRNLSVLYGR